VNDYAPAVRRILRENGFEFWRQGRGDHEIWRHAATGKKITMDGKIKSRHSANKVMKDAGLPKAF
jgi:predicted RNA binding protein YcfA (HicA-like mRNA interferase family)